MKIRSLLLGSIAAAGLSTAGFAADLGVVTSLDVCDELGLSGLTISSDDNCLVISGGVTVEYQIGDFAPADDVFVFDRTGGVFDVPDNDGVLDSKLDIDVWLKFAASADSDFGPATATIKLLREDYNGTGDFTFLIDEAWVGIGDTTQLMAGKKGSIFNDGDDAPLNYLGLFNSSSVDTGVGFSGAGNFPVTGGSVIQVVSNLGNGLSIGGGIEALNSLGTLTAVGTLAYAGEGVTAHFSGAVDNAAVPLYKIHAGFKGTWDPITVVGAFAANNKWWNALGSVEATFDMFKLALSGEATSGGEYGVGASVSATVTDGVTLNLGGRWFDDSNDADTGYQIEAGVSAAVTETITLSAAVGAIDGNLTAGTVYGKAGLAWNPGGGFTSSVEGYANSLGGYKGTFKAAKTIK